MEIRYNFDMGKPDWFHHHGSKMNLQEAPTKQGAFIRYGNFLNIPSPGTGHDGDPNISILIDGPIRRAVRQLLI